ncbi:MAG: M48 family metallopeptidase [Bacteroidota bacterium]
MKKVFPIVIISFLLLPLLILMSSCYRNPVTGRTSLSLVDDGTVVSMANQQYSTFLTANPPVQGTAGTEMVKRVGVRMATAVREYLASSGQAGLINGYNWEFNLVNNAEANAWCLPGGKVVVYSGILPYTVTETGLAVVMGHEIAHAIARHGNERMSQALAQQYGGAALSAVVSTRPAEMQTVFNTAYGVTSTLGALAYSRKQEYEADEMGLYFMAMAGYNPTEATEFWGRMAARGGARPPEFLSTHPGNDDRISHIRTLLPKAMRYYNKQPQTK